MATIARDARGRLEARQSVLIQRLKDGDRRIDAARAIGADTRQWEAFWLQLLDEYVDISSRLDAVQPEMADIAA